MGSLGLLASLLFLLEQVAQEGLYRVREVVLLADLLARLLALALAGLLGWWSGLLEAVE